MGLIEKDKKYLWHPYTRIKDDLPPVPVVKGEGAFLYDEDGTKYLDATSSWWVNVHGHSHPLIARRIAEQAMRLEHVMFAGFTHEPAVELAEHLLEKLPSNQSKIFYSDNGSTAVEVALKMALQFWNNQGVDKTGILALDGAYHGDTFGAMSAGTRTTFNAAFNPFLFDVTHLPFPAADNGRTTLEALERKVSRGDVAALIVEPLVQGAAGMRMYSPEILNRMFAICRENKVLIIADEVLTGFGRTGRFFASDYVEEKPDIMCLSKGLTGGFMALGATSCTDEIFSAFISDNRAKTFYHGHSFTANPMACAAANASMEIFSSPSTWDCIEKISCMQNDFAEKLSAMPHVENPRTLGTILAFDLETAGQTSYFNAVRDEVMQFFRSRGILLRPLGNVVYVLPPFCIPTDELRRVHEALSDFLNTYSSSGSFTSS